jgi:peroxiredoxin family protein
MPGLLLVLTERGTARAAAALETAAAAAALGRPVAVLLKGSDFADCPALQTLRALGGQLGACQAAMAEAGVTAADLPPGTVPQGLVTFLADRADWQLVLA